MNSSQMAMLPYDDKDREAGGKSKEYQHNKHPAC